MPDSRTVIYKTREELPLNTSIIDTVPGALRELMVIRHPELKSAEEKVDDYLKKFIEQNGGAETVYAYYSWRNTAVHILNEDTYFELRTARNRNIITKDEQKKYRDIKIGIIGISIGYNVLSALAFSGGPKYMRISDNDVIEITNLNRLRAPLLAVGMNKADFAAQQILELDPFCELDVWPQGVTRDTLKQYIVGPPKLDVFVDEMDSLDLKILSRIVCRENKIPVVMATNDGDNVILDVERFDEEPEREILHGLARDVEIDKIKGVTYSQWVEIAKKIVDARNLSPRMQESLAEVGKTIAAVPQLGTTAAIGGATVAYIIRKMAIGEKMPSGRYIVSLDRSIKKDKPTFWRQFLHAKL